MPDREKVIKGLEICYIPPSKCDDCPYHGREDCTDALCLDALALLKEQEPQVMTAEEVDKYSWMDEFVQTDRKGLREMPELTKQGYDMIIDRIVNRTIKVPEDMPLNELQAWMTGYGKCQLDIIDLIVALKESNGR